MKKSDQTPFTDLLESFLPRRPLAIFSNRSRFHKGVARTVSLPFFFLFLVFFRFFPFFLFVFLCSCIFPFLPPQKTGDIVGETPLRNTDIIAMANQALALANPAAMVRGRRRTHCGFAGDGDVCHGNLRKFGA